MKTFVYNISLKSLEYTPKTAAKAFGYKNAYNPDYKIDTFVRDDVGLLFQDAISFCYMMKMDYIAGLSKVETEWTTDQKDQLEWYDKKVELYEKLRGSLTLVEVKD